MTKQLYTPQQLKVLNSRKGLSALLRGDTINPTRAIRNVLYERRLEELQEELLKMQQHIQKNNKKVVILFEGRDAAGKGGAIRRIVEHLPPREIRVVALPKPDEVERGQWYFQRYINQLPKEGEIVFFDRSWYNRAVVEPVNGFCSDAEYKVFMEQVNDVERMMIESGITIIKLYFSISKPEQTRRFKEIRTSPVKKWKFSPVDQRAIELWDDYTSYKERMFKSTQKHAKWKVIRANRKTYARIAALEYILNKIDYTPKDKEVIKHKKWDKQ